MSRSKGAIWSGLPGREHGLTLIELMLVIGILGILLTIAVAQYGDYEERARVSETIHILRSIEVQITGFALINGRFPDDLAEVELDGVRDSWGGPIYYLDLTGPGNGGARKDRRLNPLNSDFDLFSAGADGTYRTQITHRTSLDDVIRARDGQFMDLASRF